MKRTAAIIAGQAFPPIASANVHRVLAWARHLPDFGWTPAIVALPLDYRPQRDLDASLLGLIPPTALIRRPASLFHRRLPTRFGRHETARLVDRGHARASPLVFNLVRLLKDGVLIPDTRILWVPSAVNEVRALAAQTRVDAVISTSREDSSHVAGWRVAAALRVPWVADFQDPWETPWRRAITPLHSVVLRWLGRKILTRADRVTVTSENIRKLMSSRYGLPLSRFRVVTNGFTSPAEMPSGPPQMRERVVLLHTGRFYGHRSPAELLAGASRLAEARPGPASRFLIRLVGDLDAASARVVERHAGAPWLECRGRVPFAESLRLQADADVLVLIPGEDSYSLPGKVFEYLAARRPILALCSEESDTAQLLRTLGAGLVVPPDDPTATAIAIERLLDLSFRAQLVPEDLIGRLRPYDWKTVVGQMAGILDELVRTQGSKTQAT